MGMAISVPRFTIEDLDRFPDDGNRYELLDGFLIVTPAPNSAHQIVASRLQARLVEGLAWPGHAHVVGPGAVVKTPRTQLQPDILVYPSRYSPQTEWAKIGEHWLAVEVFSRSSRIYDRELKRDAYFALGVQQVWLVDPRSLSVEVWKERGTSRVVRNRIVWKVAGAKVHVSIDLAEIFAGIDADPPRGRTRG
jgi:Uma2 family endonuclease